ncbi:hypothetical protein LCGC14_0496750 [marine sediment metagenome]|uniref:Uncharacterized protein n=1 Tax=marine sediment metagenome TaxID=412755 RepID=A0A0F9VDS4_9ZZZZ|nr:MAG: hypothetical protein Lokiarch_32100 [Candidatus Lokiarchaeum sp. GC14_75]
MRQFDVNEYITLKLEENKTNIYIGNKKFLQCKYLLLNIPVEKISDFDEIESVDEAAEKLDKSQEKGNKKRNAIKIPIGIILNHLIF